MVLRRRVLIMSVSLRVFSLGPGFGLFSFAQFVDQVDAFWLTHFGCR